MYGNTNFVPSKLCNLPSIVKETSGLFIYNDLLWTHNDSGGEPVLYAFNLANNVFVRSVVLKNAKNVDWEDVVIDEENVYVADIGNNNGNRKNMKIYVFPLEDLDLDSVETTSFDVSFPDQVDFTSSPNKTNFDAEAIVNLGEELFIFSKNWVNQRCRIYSIAKNDESKEVRLRHEWNSNGMITGGDFNATDSVLILCGYNGLLQPFIWMFWDFEGEFWNGNKRRVNLNLPFHQTEGIAHYKDDLYYLSNEAFTTLGNVPSYLFSFRTKNWIDETNNFIQSSSSETGEEGNISEEFKIYPNPSKDFVKLSWDNHINISAIELYSIDGRQSEMWFNNPINHERELDVSMYESGNYIVVLTSDEKKYAQQVVIQK